MSVSWISGGRVAPRVVERHLADALLSGSREAAACRVARRCERIWRHANETLGPASGAQAVWTHVVEPCAEAFGWPTQAVLPTQAAGLRLYAGRPSAGLADTLLVAVPWGVRLSGLQRALVRLGLDAQASWVAVCNGRHWCWFDATRPFVRDHLVVDLTRAAADARVWQALWLLGQPLPRRRTADKASRWLDHAIATTVAEDADAGRVLRAGVAAAMRTLDDVDAGRRDDHVRQVLQWLFLLCAEARALLPAWHQPYRRSYALAELATTAPPAARVSIGVHDSVTAIARLGRAGARIGPVAVAALNGRLFDDTSLTHRGTGVADEPLASALAQLSGAAATGSVPVDFEDLRVEHLGALYEHLMAPAPAAGGTPLLRKRTGAFYTPRLLADLVVQRTLGPLVEHASSHDILALRVLDPAMGSGALLASALRFLVGAVEAAWIHEGRGGPLDVAPADRESLPRRVAEQCLFGVDLDGVAVQVARMSLWLLSLSPDRPLTWLDGHLRTGNSLVGTSPAALLARVPLQGRPARRHDGQLTLFDLSQWHHEAGVVGPLLAALSARPTESAHDARAKSDGLARLRSRDGLVQWRARADAWCGAAMDGASPSAAAWRDVDDLLREGPGTRARRDTTERQARWQAAATSQGCFHWSLEFPDVFDAGRGGFDAVIANPPWEMLRADLGSDGDRAARRGDLEPLLRFVKRSGVYRRVSGHVNSYQLFTERMLQLLRPAGRIGCLLPGAILGDHGAADLRRHLFEHCAVDRVSIVENRTGLFPVHRSMRIVCITGTAGATTEAFVVDDGPRSASRADAKPAMADEGRVVTRSLMQRLTATAAIPHVRHARDLRVLTALAAAPALGEPPWRLRFGRELNATEDRAWLHDGRPGPHALGVVEGKHLRSFAVRPPDDGRWIDDADAARLLPHAPWTRWRLAYRDISAPGNARSLIVGLLPPGCVSTHTIFCLRSRCGLRTQLYVCGMLGSLVSDWYVRRFLGAHVTTGLMASIRVPAAAIDDSDRRLVTTLALRLLRAPDDEDLQARLHAAAARLHGLSGDDLAHIADDFPRLSAAVRSGMLRHMRGGARTVA